MDSSIPDCNWRLWKLQGDVADGQPAAPFSTNLQAAIDAGFTHILSEPTSEMPDPAVISVLLTEASRAPQAAVLACGDKVRRAAASLERLCLRLETGVYIPEPHTPYRIYPLAPLCTLARIRRLAIPETERLTHLSWGGVPVHVVARPGLALGGAPSLRAAWGHARLLLRRLIPWPHPKLQDSPAEKPIDLWHPIRLLRQVLKEHASPRDLAIASFVGVFMGALPLLACHMVAILYVTTRFRLNRGMAIATQNLCAPPVVPVLCVEVGYFLRHGSWLVEVNRQTLLLDLHVRLWEWFLGSLIVGPLLGLLTAAIAYVAAQSLARWSGKTPAHERLNDRRRGNRLGYLSFEIILRMFGRRGAYALLRMVALYYVAFDRSLRRLTAPYLHRCFPDHRGWRRIRDIYQLVYSQGVSLIDRYRMLITPEVFTQNIAHYEPIGPLVADRTRGFVLLVSHVGNWQALLLALKRMDRGITLLMRPEENPVVQDYLRVGDRSQPFQIVSPDAPMGGVIELTQRFGQGDVIAIMGDRAYDAATLPVNFMGETAYFPCGPFQLAAAWECPVVAMFAVKTGTDEYTADMAGIIQVQRTGDRRKNLQTAMQTYANLLQTIAGQHPYQVYLFDDVWRARESISKSASTAARARN